jgi:hypothetical protein
LPRAQRERHRVPKRRANVTAERGERRVGPRGGKGGEGESFLHTPLYAEGMASAGARHAARELAIVLFSLREGRLQSSRG